MNDYGVVTAPRTLRIERILPGAIERIWDYLTESDKRRQWMASGDMALQIGAESVLVWRNSELTDRDDSPPAKYAQYAGESAMRVRITACEPPRLLSYTWGESDGLPSEVSFELTPQGNDVRLVVTHRRLPSREEMLSTAAGWHTHLEILVDRLNGRTPSGFWATHTRLEREYEQRIPAEDSPA